MTQNPQRFSGRELGLLLSQVRDELGEDATIIEANKVREGGLGGFFAKERFEVVATAPTVSGGGGDAVDVDGPPAASMSTASAGDHLGHLLDRAERISGAERRSARSAADAGSAGTHHHAEAATSPDPGAGLHGSDEDDRRFDELLRGALADLVPVDGGGVTAEPAAHGPGTAAWAGGPASPSPVTERPASSVGQIPTLAARDWAATPQAAPPPPPPPPPHLQTAPSAVPSATPPMPPPMPPPPHRPAAVAAVPTRPGPTAAPQAAPARQRDLRTLPGGAFWDGLVRFEQLLDDTPLAADLTTVVGPLDDAVAVARHLARQSGIDAGDLVVVTDRRSVDGVPPWQVVDRRDDLTDRVRYWRANGRRAIVVVDLDDGERGLERTARTVETAAADLTRLVVTGFDDPVALAATLRGLGPVAAIDVSRPPRPEALVDAVEQGVRIGTVCGRPLTAMLLAGLAATIDHG